VPEKLPFKIMSQLKGGSLSLVVGWEKDSGVLGATVIEYLNKKLKGQEFGEIEVSRFFSLDGVAVENKVVQFPRNRLYACEKKSLLLFAGDPPQHEWYAFLTALIDVAQTHAGVKEIYTVGGMAGLNAHTVPRELFAVFSSAEMKERLSAYHSWRDMDYQTPAGQRPTFNSFLMWAARRRGIQSVSLWVPIPFYLISAGDAQARKIVLEFFDQRLISATSTRRSYIKIKR